MKKNPVARKLWKRVVLEQAMNQCELRIDDNCGGVATDPHHLVGASYQRYELDPRNGFAVCRLCHNWIHAHEKVEFIEWLEENRMELADWIGHAHVNYKSPTQEEIDEQIRQLKCYLGMDPHGDSQGNAPVGA